MSDHPIIADNKPKQVTLNKDEEYNFCACGQSKNQPFCDGSHIGTSFKPQAFTAEQDGEAHLCACKHTANAPYCDGSHKQFSADLVGKEGPGVTSNATRSAIPTAEEPTVAFIHQLAREGLSRLGHHGPMTAMGVPRHKLPHWDDIQIMAAQMASKPLMEDQAVGTELIVGPESERPLLLKIPIFVSDMSFGALSEEAKVALAAANKSSGVSNSAIRPKSVDSASCGIDY